MIPWDNVTISARARITQANKRLRSLTAGGGRHGMAISRGLVVQNGRCSRRSPSVVVRLGMRPQCTQPQAAYATAKFPLVAHATLHVVGAFSRTAIVSCGTRPAWAIGDRGGSVSPTCSGQLSKPRTALRAVLGIARRGLLTGCAGAPRPLCRVVVRGKMKLYKALLRSAPLRPNAAASVAPVPRPSHFPTTQPSTAEK